MICYKCKKEIADSSIFCQWCGKKQVAEHKRSTKSRGNGQGCAYLIGKGNWCVEVTIAYTDDGKRIRKKKQGFATKREALEYVPILKKEVKQDKSITLRQAFDGMMAENDAGKNTRAYYISSFKYFSSLEYYSLDNIDIKSLQECLDNASIKKQSKSHLRTVLHLCYAYAIRKELYHGTDKSKNLILTGNGEKKEKPSFTMEQLEKIKNEGSDFALLVYCHCFLGFRPTEFISIKAENVDFEKRIITGIGSKTEAGKNRVVTIPLRISLILKNIVEQTERGKSIFPYTEVTYRTKFNELMVKLGFNKNGETTFTPHSCRHTYATLLMRSNAPEKLKLQLIGHSTADMLTYYQDGKQLADLQAVTDNL